MVVGITRALTVLSIAQYALRAGERADTTTPDLLQQRGEEMEKENCQVQPDPYDTLGQDQPLVYALPKNNFLSGLRPAGGVAGSAYEDLSTHEDTIIDHPLLVPLGPTLGHFFQRSWAAAIPPTPEDELKRSRGSRFPYNLGSRPCLDVGNLPAG